VEFAVITAELLKTQDLNVNISGSNTRGYTVKNVENDIHSGIFTDRGHPKFMNDLY
jgi:hypothetical protein